MESVSPPVQQRHFFGMNWRKPVPAFRSGITRLKRNRLAILGLMVGLLVTAIGMWNLPKFAQRQSYIRLTTSTDTALVQQIVNEELVVSYLIVETKGGDKKPISIARRLILTHPSATDSVLTILAHVKDDNTFEVSFLRGYVLLQDRQKSPSSAVTALRQASQSSDKRIREEASWYLALAYLKNMDLAKAYPLLIQIANSSSGHRPYAQKIVSVLTDR